MTVDQDDLKYAEISKISDPQILMRIYKEQIKQKVDEITHKAGMSACDSHRKNHKLITKLSDKHYNELEANYK